MLFRLLISLVTISFGAQAATINDIETQIKAAKAAGKHTWIQILDNTSTSSFRSDSESFEKNVFSPNFVSQLGEEFNVITLTSREMNASPELNKWVGQFKILSRPTTILLDSEGMMYLKQNSTEAMSKYDSKADREKIFLDKAHELKLTREGYTQLRKAKQQVSALPFVASAIENARATGKTVLLNIEPSKEISSFFSTRNADAILNNHSGSKLAKSEESASDTAAARQRLFSLNNSAIAPPNTRPAASSTAPANRFELVNVTAGSNGVNEFFKIIGKRPQSLIAVVANDGSVDFTVNPIQWINQHRSDTHAPGGPYRLEELEAFGRMLTTQPAAASARLRSSYCGAYLSLVSGATF